jgi:alcohol dehydrogenase class IV
LQKHEQWSRRWELADLESASLGSAYLYASPSVCQRVTERFALPLIGCVDAVPAGAETLLVAAGGTPIDYAKYLRVTQLPRLRLLAMPSIWGSAAEVSPIAVLNRERKEIHCSNSLIPDRYVIWPELAQSASLDLLRFACGDVWAHALEAFCSPLASDATRAQATELMNEIAAYPLGFDSRWFDASASACLLQARSSVGLIHAFAHVLEPLLRVAEPASQWGHAKLCSAFLLPALSFNMSRSSKVKTLAAGFGLNLDAVRAVAQRLFKESDYVAAMAVAEEHWEAIARDRCSRTNCVLVRRDSVVFFQQFVASGVIA